jgi:hypothetical protein
MTMIVGSALGMTAPAADAPLPNDNDGGRPLGASGEKVGLQSFLGGS